MTELLRTSKDPLFAAHREVLRRQGLDVRRLWLIDHYESDDWQEAGFVCTDDGRAYDYSFSYERGYVGEGLELLDWFDRSDLRNGGPAMPVARRIWALHGVR